MIVKNIFITTLGCSKNEIDTELMISLIKKEKFTIVHSPEDADVIIINTCSFIREAKEESIEIIWEISRYKEKGKCKFIILTGCLAQRYPEELLNEIEEVDGVIGTGNIQSIIPMIIELQKGKKKLKSIGDINGNYLEKIDRFNFTTSKYVKISEGCNNFCTYCIIPNLRGKHRSRKMENIIKEVEFFANNGVKEVILVGQNITDYGIDLYGEYKLHKLLDELNNIKRLKWIRLLYLYPDNITDKLITSIKQNSKVLKYLDIPLQHINNSILKNMNRKTSKNYIIKLVSTLRKQIPEVIIRTTFIVGFPGETRERFDELYDFVEAVKFDRLGVFTYSREEGTPAYNFSGQINESIKIQRRDQLMKLQQKISYSLNCKKINNVYEVLVEDKIEKNIYSGRTYMDSPDIDGVVFIKSDQNLKCGEYTYVKIVDALEYDLIGEVTNEFSK